MNDLRSDLLKLRMDPREIGPTEAGLTDYLTEIAAATSQELLQDACLRLCTEKFLNDLRTCTANETGAQLCLLAVQIIAELAKCDSGRTKLEEFLPQLSAVLSSTHVSDVQMELLEKQVLRAIANICYENDSGRGKFLEAGGVSVLLKVINILAEKESSLLSVGVACLCNVLDSNEPCQKAALDDGFLNILVSCCSSDENVQFGLIACLTSMADSEDLLRTIQKSPVHQQLIYLLNAENTSVSILESVLQLLIELAVEEEYKAKVAESNIVESLCNVICRDVGVDVSQAAGNFLVELLTETSCVEAALKQVTGNSILCAAMTWMDDAEKIYLQTTAALVVGNLARSYSNCSLLINFSHEGSDGLVNKLLDLLRSTPSYAETQNGHCLEGGDIDAQQLDLETPENDGNVLAGKLPDDKKIRRSQILQLQYALLCALKNMAVAEDLRLELVKQGLIDVLVILAMDFGKRPVDGFVTPVIGKLMTLLRMCVSLSEKIACDVASNPLTMKQVLQWCSLPNAAHESLRFVVTAVKHSNYALPVTSCLRTNMILTSITRLMGCDSMIAKMDGIGAASVLVANGDPEEVMLETEVPEFVSALNSCLEDPAFHVEGTSSALKVIEKLCTIKNFRSIILSVGMLPVIQTFTSHSHELVQKSATDVVKILSEKWFLKP